MTYKNLGITIIDKLHICFTAEMPTLECLREVKQGERFKVDNFSLERVNCSHFRTGFNVYVASDTIAEEKIASLMFDRYGDSELSTYIFYWIENHVLYSKEKFNLAVALTSVLGLYFHNFTSIELARDYGKSIVTIMKRLFKDKSVTTIVNGKAVKDRKEIIETMFEQHSITLEKTKYPSICIKQEKALRNKYEGVSVCAYNKVAEIKYASGKQYILDFYGNPKRLHRLEVALNSGEIRDYCTSRGITQKFDLIYNQEILSEMFLYHLSSVLRFTKKRKMQSWDEIICNGRAI